MQDLGSYMQIGLPQSCALMLPQNGDIYEDLKYQAESKQN